MDFREVVLDFYKKNNYLQVMILQVNFGRDNNIGVRNENSVNDRIEKVVEDVFQVDTVLGDKISLDRKDDKGVDSFFEIEVLQEHDKVYVKDDVEDVNQRVFDLLVPFCFQIVVLYYIANVCIVDVDKGGIV